MIRKYLYSLLLLLCALPVWAQTTIGYTNVPDGGGNTGGEYAFATPLLTMSEAGTFSSVSLYATDESGTGTRQAIIRIYDAAGNTLATSATASGFSASGSWVTVAISYAATASQQLRFAAISEGAPLYVGVTNGHPGDGFYSDVGGSGTYPQWPTDPASFSNDFDWRLAAYGTYTPAGGGAVTKIMQQH